jgi:hypothetical protein
MIIKANQSKRGIKIVMGDRDSEISYPQIIWEKFPENLKQVLLDNLAYSKTMVVSVVDGINQVEYDTAPPILKTFFDSCCVKDMPRMPMDRNNGLKTEEIMRKFVNSEYRFLKQDIAYPNYDAKAESGSVTAFSFGKDSLLSYALLEEAGVEQELVYVKDMFDCEASAKDLLKTRFEKEFKRQINVVNDSSDKLFIEMHDKFNPLLTNAINSYSLIMLPFTYYHNYKYIVFGNEKNLSNCFINKEGYRVYASYDQTAEWVRQQTTFMSLLTSNKIKVFSPIETIHNLATMKILNSRYPKYAKYQLTCPLDEGEEGDIWCGKCSECAKLYSIMKALNVDVKERGFKTDMFTKENKKFFTLFEGEDVLAYDRPNESREEQLLTFYMAYRNKAKGDLIDEFKKRFLDEARQREDELYGKYMASAQPENIPLELRNGIMSIIKEELR